MAILQLSFLKSAVARVLIALAFVFSLLNVGYASDKIFADSSVHQRYVVHHHFDGGVICRLGREHVSTYNDYDHTTTSASTYPVGKYARFLTFRLAHGLVFKKNFEGGITYGADIYIQPHDVRAFVPLMLHLLNDTRLSKKTALLFIQRAGYSFYVRNRSSDPFMKYPGVEGGFTSESLAGVSILTKHKTYLQILLGYRFQQLYIKSVFSPDQSLMQQGSNYAGLPGKITETSNALYHFIYLSLGVPF